MEQNSVSKLQTQAILEHLILQNAVEISGIDSDSGEMLYSITDKLQSVSPWLYEELKEDFENNMFKMIAKGPESMQWRFNLESFNG